MTLMLTYDIKVLLGLPTKLLEISKTIGGMEMLT